MNDKEFAELVEAVDKVMSKSVECDECRALLDLPKRTVKFVAEYKIVSGGNVLNVCRKYDAEEVANGRYRAEDAMCLVDDDISIVDSYDYFLFDIPENTISASLKIVYIDEHRKSCQRPFELDYLDIVRAVYKGEYECSEDEDGYALTEKGRDYLEELNKDGSNG